MYVFSFLSHHPVVDLTSDALLIILILVSFFALTWMERIIGYSTISSIYHLFDRK
jgi:hypothetical protein